MLENIENHPKVKFGRTGVLIINLGTPDGTDFWSIRRYLKEFLSDRRVIDINRFLWWLILNLIILTFRPKKTGKAYKEIWNYDKNESPVKTYTRSQAQLLSERFKQISLREKQQQIRSGINYLDKLLPELQSNVFEIQNELVDFNEWKLKKTNSIDKYFIISREVVDLAYQKNLILYLHQ